MLQEHHHQGRFHWPNNSRVAVTLTFDFQGGEDVRPLPDGTRDHEEYTQCEYGPNTAIWRMRILDEEGVKATFLTCGAIAERYPDAVHRLVLVPWTNSFPLFLVAGLRRILWLRRGRPQRRFRLWRSRLGAVGPL